MKSTLLIILLIIGINTASACKVPDHEWARTLNSEKHSVKGPYSIEQLENKNMVTIRETQEVLAFGYVNKEWNQLKSLYKSGDQFFHVRFQDGRFVVTQHVLVRGECIIGALRESIT